MDYTLVIIKISNRENAAKNVQEVLTGFGCNIKVRLGLHDIPSDSCSASGLIILEISSTNNERDDFIKKLNEIDGVIAKDLLI